MFLPWASCVVVHSKQTPQVRGITTCDVVRAGCIPALRDTRPPHPMEKCWRIRLLLAGNSLGGRAAPSCLARSISGQSNTQIQGLPGCGKQGAAQGKGHHHCGGDGEQMEEAPWQQSAVWYSSHPCAQEHPVEGKEESRISRFIKPRSRAEKLRLVTQTSYLLYIWQLCLKVSGTDEAYCAWHCTCVYFKIVLATESLELTQNGIFNESTIIATTKMKTKL